MTEAVIELNSLGVGDESPQEKFKDPDEVRVSDRMTSELLNAIEEGKSEEVIEWMNCIPPDQLKETINTVKSEQSLTALQLATKHNQPDIARLLLNAGADPNISGGDWQFTLLQLATKLKHSEIARLLLDAGADPNVTNPKKRTTALYLACRHSTGEVTTKLIKLIVDRGGDVNGVGNFKRTPLHEVTIYGNVDAVEYLLENGADMELRDDNENQPIHLASRTGNTEIIDIFVKKCPQCVHWKSKSSKTPLHIAAENGHKYAVKYLLDTITDKESKDDAKTYVNAKDDDGYSSLCRAIKGRNIELAKILLEAGAGKTDATPLQRACYYGYSDFVSLLIKHGAKVDSKSLNTAVSEGYEDIAKQLILTPKWPLLLRHTLPNNECSTPFREMIRKMPDVAELILNKCTVGDPDIANPYDFGYNVVYNYEFMEDTRNKLVEGESHEANECGTSYSVVHRERLMAAGTSWGPEEFKKGNHPLAIMVESKRLNLLTHPLVGSLLHYKWRVFGLYGYLFNLLTYCVFLIFLTTFALIVENPRGQACTMNTTVSFTLDCGISRVRLVFIYICSIIVILMALIRLILEVIQLILQFPRYFLDWINWVEVLLFVTSIIFVWVFHVDCLCPLEWQWQVGVVSVFLGWIILIIFVSKFPLTGIYVLMFINVLYTFIKVLLLSILLLVAFGLAFYLAFTQPEILRSPFSTPGLSLLKLMSMTAGDFEFDSIFRQDPAGESDDAEDIPFNEISYILWIVFVILMPILLTNMLVGLAVGDIQLIQGESELKKLALQVQLVLTVEEILRYIFRRDFSIRSMEVYPNRKDTYRQQVHYFFWGGEKYDTQESIQKVIRPQQDENEKLRAQTEELLEEVRSFKDENETIREQATELCAEMKSLKIELLKVKEMMTLITSKVNEGENGSATGSL